MLISAIQTYMYKNFTQRDTAITIGQAVAATV